MKPLHITEKVLSKSWIQHLLFWAFSFFILLRLFSSGNELHKIDYIYNFLFHLTLIPGVYFNLYYLIPKLFSRKKYIYYGFSIVAITIFFSELNILFFEYLVDILLPGYYFISYYEILDIIQFFVAFLCITTLLKLSKSWFLLSEAEKKLNFANKEKLDIELRALKSQINPHFLFNSLNNIYALSLKKDNKTSEIILKLSDSLRYMLYESNSERVPLTNEINFIKNYIDIQKLRSDNTASISFKTEGNCEKLKIAPLIFIPFIENSFKHGIKGETGKSFIDIKLTVNNLQLQFKIKNNIGLVDDVEKKKFGGIGLENVKQRLLLIYPEKHHLNIKKSETDFIVDLKIDL